MSVINLLMLGVVTSNIPVACLLSVHHASLIGFQKTVFYVKYAATSAMTSSIPIPVLEPDSLNTGANLATWILYNGNVYINSTHIWHKFDNFTQTLNSRYCEFKLVSISILEEIIPGYGAMADLPEQSNIVYLFHCLFSCDITNLMGKPGFPQLINQLFVSVNGSIYTADNTALNPIPDQDKTNLRSWNAVTKYLDNSNRKFVRLAFSKPKDNTTATLKHKIFSPTPTAKLISFLCKNLNATEVTRNNTHYLVEEKMIATEIEEFYASQLSPALHNGRTGLCVGWCQSVFIEKREKFGIVYCESYLRIAPLTMAYWLGPHSIATWAMLSALILVFTTFVSGICTGNMTKSSFEVVRIIFKQNVTNWFGRKHVILSFSLLVIQVGYEGAFTSKMAVNPKPITIQNMEELLQNGYNFSTDIYSIIPPEYVSMYEGFHQFATQIMYYVVTHSLPFLLSIFKYKFPVNEKPSDRWVFPFKSGDCGKTFQECLQNDGYKIASIVRDSKKLATLVKYQHLVGNKKYCHLVKDPVWEEEVGWTFKYRWHKEFKVLASLLRENGMLQHWTQLANWWSQSVQASMYFHQKGKRKSKDNHPATTGNKASGDASAAQNESLQRLRMLGSGKHVLSIYWSLVMVSVATLVGEVALSYKNECLPSTF